MQKQIVNTISKTATRAATHMIMTVISLGCLSLPLSVVPFDLDGIDVVDGEALGDVANAGADNETDNIMSKSKVLKRKVRQKKDIHKKEGSLM